MRRVFQWLAMLCAMSATGSATSANTEGFYDASFSGDGRQLVDVSASTTDKGKILRIQQPSGKLLIGGTCGSGATVYFCVTRLDSAGAIDLGFGPDNTGTIKFDRFFPQGFPTSDTLVDMLALSDGRILILGVGTLAMLTANGAGLDTSVTGGTGYIGVFGQYALAEQPDHDILMVGYAVRGDMSGNFDMSVRRLLPDLSPDDTFDTDGSQTVEFNLGDASSIAQSVAVQANGSIVIAGYVAFNAQQGKSVGVARLLSTGALDPQFGGGAPIYQTYNVENVALSVRVDQRGRIVYGGYSATDTNFGTRKCLVNRLLANGNQDFSFNGNQAQQFYVTVSNTLAPCEIVDVVPQPDGTVLGVGSLADYYFTAVRLTPAGIFDSTFGASGVSVGAFDPSATNSVVRSGSTAIGNGLMIAGTNTAVDSKFGVAQLTLTVRIFASGFDY